MKKAVPLSSGVARIDKLYIYRVSYAAQFNESKLNIYLFEKGQLAYTVPKQSMCCKHKKRFAMSSEGTISLRSVQSHYCNLYIS
jgi:hypothetical protein